MQITISSLPIFEAMIFRYISAYLHHQFKANTRHGTHSPFVYKLADEVIYDFSLKKVYNELADQRKKLLNDLKKEAFLVKEGSKEKLKQDLSIANKRIKNERWLTLIYRLAQSQQPSHILELNTHLGISTSYLAKACANATVISLVDQSSLLPYIEQHFDALGITNVQLTLGEQREAFEEVITSIKHLEFVYLNNGAVNLYYFEACVLKVNEHTILIFEGLYENESSTKNWETIKNHPSVTVTVDLFSIGLVYFRKGQAKEHFKLKY